MTYDPRGRGPLDRPPIVDADQLLAALLTLGCAVPDERATSRARLLGMLTAWVDMTTMFDLDRLDADDARQGLIDVMTDGARAVVAGSTPFLATESEVMAAANEMLGRLIEHRLNTLRLDLEELTDPTAPEHLGIPGATVALLRALCAIAPLFNRTGGNTSRAEVNKAAKAALKHMGEGRQSLHHLMKQTS